MSDATRIGCKDAATHRAPKWPLLGYAPGGYMNRCIVCRDVFWNLDKRAFHCLPCAIEQVPVLLEANRLEIKTLREENETLKRAISIKEQAE